MIALSVRSCSLVAPGLAALVAIAPLAFAAPPASPQAPQPTRLEVSGNATAPLGGYLDMKVRLVGPSGPIPMAGLKFMLDGKLLFGTTLPVTGSDGVAPWTPGVSGVLALGDHEMTVDYPGNAQFAPSHAAARVTLVRGTGHVMNLKAAVQAPTGRMGPQFSVSGNLSTCAWGAAVDLEVAGQKIAALHSNSAGIFSHQGTWSQGAGSFPVVVTFAGNAKCAGGAARTMVSYSPPAAPFPAPK